eukprot:1155916-Pelagomonas_calceolata.AAC.8
MASFSYAYMPLPPCCLPAAGTPEANFMARSFKLKRLRSNPGHASGWIFNEADNNVIQTRQVVFIVCLHGRSRSGKMHTVCHEGVSIMSKSYPHVQSPPPEDLDVQLIKVVVSKMSSLQVTGRENGRPPVKTTNC